MSYWILFGLFRVTTTYSPTLPGSATLVWTMTQNACIATDQYLVLTITWRGLVNYKVLAIKLVAVP